MRLENTLNEKVDYSKDPEGSISLGMKLLKKLEKEGWKGADIYDEIYEIIVMSDVKHPKQMALRLKRTLENYDMWEAPYKGIVNKIQKWEFVNENATSIITPIVRTARTLATVNAANKLVDKSSDKTNESTEDLESDDLYFDKFYDADRAKRVKFEFYIDPRCYNVIYNRLVNGKIKNVKVIYEDDNYLEISAPHNEYNNIIRLGNKMLDDQFIDDFNLVESIKTNKSSKLNETEFNNYGPIDDFDKAYAAIDKLIYKSKEWTLDDVRNQLDNGDIWFQDVMNEMGIDMNSLSDEEDEKLCNTIIDVMQNYLDDKDYFGQLHENSYQSDFADKFAYDKYYRPRDIQELMQKSKQRGVQLSRFEHWVLEAALWARSRNNNYHGYSKEIPAVQYKNGKFYAQTIHDGMTEVPYNYDVMTPEWLFQK